MRSLFVLTLLGLPACVSYQEQPVALDAVEREIATRSAARLDYAAAVRLAFAQNPTLRGLAAEARAAGLDIPAVPLNATVNEGTEVVGARVDLLQLAKIGPRGAAASAAHARQVEALAALREHQRRIAADIARTYLVERVLRDRTVPAIVLDAERFAAAGLASEANVKRVAFARAAQRAEETTIAAERRVNRARLRSLLGVAPDAAVVFVLPEEPFVAPDRDGLLARPDLALALARYATADAEFRRAVIAQYPTLELGGEITFDGNGAGGLVALRIPLGASKPARAAGERREAARIAVEAALVEAQRQVEATGARLDAAVARAAAAAQRADAAVALYDAARARLEIETDAFAMAAEMASLAVRTSIQARETALAAARARIAHAEALGWPRTEDLQ